MLENFQGDSWGSIPPLRVRSLLPHDLCHGRSTSRWLPAVIEFQLSYSRSWKMMLWKVLHSICSMHYALNMQYAGSRHHMTQKAHSWACIWRKIVICKDTCTSVFIAELFTIARIWKQLKCSSRVKDKESVPIYNRILFNHKKEQSNAICCKIGGGGRLPRWG